MNTKNLKGAILAAAGVLLLATGAAAEKRVDETRKLDEDARVSVENMAGSITVAGWDREEIRIEGLLSDQVERLDIDGDEHRLDIEVVIEEGRHRNIEGSVLEIHLPHGCELDLEGISADIAVNGVTGEIDAESVSGDIVVEGEPEEINAESVSGDVVLRVSCEVIEAASVSGDVEITGGAARETDAASVSGDIELRDFEVRRLDAESVSGEILFQGVLRPDAVFSLGCQSGDIRLELEGEVNAEFDLETFSGSIRSDFGPEPRKRDRWLPGSELYFSVGEGRAQVEIESFSGDIQLQKR